MSNPGVIVLATTKKNILQRILNRNSFRIFQVEDNIGEAIHIHLDDLRIELSIDDFFELCDGLKVALNELVNIENFNIKHIDPLFFKYVSKYLEDLENIKIHKVYKDEVKFLLNNNRLKLYQVKKFKDFTEDDLFNRNVEERNYLFYPRKKDKNEILKKIDINFKPILDDDLIVRDGKHRLFLKFKENDYSEAQIWKFKKNSFRINITLYYFSELFKRFFIFLMNSKNRFMQLFQNILEKYF